MRVKILTHLFSGILVAGLLSCSQDSAFELALKKASVACFTGGNCGGCSRIEGYIGVATNLNEEANLKKLSNYFSENGDIINVVPETVYAGFIPAWVNLDIGDFTVRASSGNEYPREGNPVRNYFGLRTITSLRSPKDDHVFADFLRGHLENKDIKLMFLVNGPVEVKTFDATGVRKRVVRIEEPSADGSMQLVCLNESFRFERDKPLNLEIDSAFVVGDVNSPGRITLSLGMTDASNPLLPSLCGAKVWQESNPLMPTSGEVIKDTELVSRGVFSVPYEVFQTTAETRAKFSDWQDCPVDQFAD